MLAFYDLTVDKSKFGASGDVTLKLRTFGAPRAVTKSCVSQIEAATPRGKKDVKRFVGLGDVVTNVPRAPFKHFGARFYIQGKNCRRTGDVRCTFSVSNWNGGALWAQGKVPTLHPLNHMIATYVTRLLAAAKGGLGSATALEKATRKSKVGQSER